MAESELPWTSDVPDAGPDEVARADESVTRVEAGCTCGGMAACEQCQGRDAVQADEGPCVGCREDDGDCCHLAPAQADETLAAWWDEFDGPAYPTGAEFAAAFLASDWLATHVATIRADAEQAGARAALLSAADELVVRRENAWDNFLTASDSHEEALLQGKFDAWTAAEALVRERAEGLS